MPPNSVPPPRTRGTVAASRRIPPWGMPCHWMERPNEMAAGLGGVHNDRTRGLSLRRKAGSGVVARPLVGRPVGRGTSPRATLASSDFYPTCWCCSATILVSHAGVVATVYAVSRYLLVIGSRRSRPKARVVILMPGGAWRRLYSLRSTSVMTRCTVSRSNPISTISSPLRSSST